MFMQKKPLKIHTIVLPTMPQPDTLIAIFLLKKFGENMFFGIKTASVKLLERAEDADNTLRLEQEGYFFIDVGKGRFDHHGRKTTASALVADALGVSTDPALTKMLEYARRDDMFGKGTISEDPIDRAFGLSSLIYHLNRSLARKPDRVVDIVLPFLVAHYNEEYRRTHELPQELEKITSEGQMTSFTVKQDGSKKLKVVFIHSDNTSIAGFLRSQSGGAVDVVAQRSSSGHVNILTRPAKRIDLRALASCIRLHEADVRGRELTIDLPDLMRPGRIRDIPEWYYDFATNSIQNGGANPQSVPPTKISDEQFYKILKLGLSYKTPYGIFSDEENAIIEKKKDAYDISEPREYFFEIRLPQDSAKEIASYIHIAEPGVKLHRPENFHITLLHFGELKEEDARIVIRVARRALASLQPFRITFNHSSFSEGPVTGYEKGKAFYFRVIDEHGGDMVKELRTRLEADIVAAGVLPRNQAFTPHLTVGSVALNINPSVAERAKIDVQPFTIAVPVKKVRLTEVRKTSVGISYRARTYVTLGVHEKEAEGDEAIDQEREEQVS